MPSTNARGAKLPSGDELAQLVWHHLVSALPSSLHPGLEHVPWPLPVDDDEYRDLYGVRLEQIMDSVFRAGMDLGARPQVARWFAHLCARQFEGALPAATHYASISLCRGPQLTLNFDTLLEAAGAKEVIHLHGSVDNPRSLVTTISQYQHGLNSKTQLTMRQLLEGGRLLVVGYSGRDRDVLPLLSLFRPSEIVWLQYPGAPLTREAQELADRRQISVVESTIEDFAGARGCDAGAEFEERPIRVAIGGDESELPVEVAADAVLEMLTQQDFELSHDFARAYADTSLPKSPRFRRLEGRLLTQSGENGAALRVFLAPRSLAKNLNELAAVTSRAFMWQLPNLAVAHIARIKKGTAAKQTEFAARQRLAHQFNMGGDVARGLALDSRHMWLSEGVIAPQVRVNALVFHSDRLRAAGHMRQAESVHEEALLDAPYASPHLRAYLMLMRSHLQLCKGEAADCISTLDHADRLIHREPGCTGPTYLQGIWNDVVRANALMLDGALTEADDLINLALQSSVRENSMGKALALLHQIELNAIREEWALVDGGVQDLISHAHASRLRIPHLLAAARLIQIEGPETLATPVVRRQLDLISEWFGRRGYHLARARALGTAHRTFGDVVTAAHVAAWKTERMEPLVDWALGSPGAGRTHWILPF